MLKPGIIVFAHGSSVEAANRSVLAVTDQLAREGGYDLVETAFLELAQPDLPQAVQNLVQRGAQRIIVIPYFLTLGIHLRRDLPRIVSEISGIHHGMPIEVTEPLHGHPSLPQILNERARQALGQ